MNNHINQLLDLAIQIQQIPAPTFDEKKRAEFVHELFLKEGLLRCFHGCDRQCIRSIAGRSPIFGQRERQTDHSFRPPGYRFPGAYGSAHSREAERIHGPGIGDNSLGVAALFGLLWGLRERTTEHAGDIWLVANVGEEGLGDLRGIKAVVDRFGADVRAYLVLEGTALAHVYHRAIGVQRYRVILRTAGGHSWSDYGQPSAIHELARLVTQLTALPMQANPRTSLNVGLISGGTGVNVLAPEAALELDIRSESPEVLASLIHRVEELIRSDNREGVTSAMEVIGQRPAGEIAEDHPLVSWQRIAWPSRA